jgi:hypothetical protein
MWTYQEIKLADHAIVVTKRRPVSWKEMVATLQERAECDSGEVQISPHDKYSCLHLTFGRLQNHGKLGVSLPDLALGCGYRDAGCHLDDVRALFPTMGLT